MARKIKVRSKLTRISLRERKDLGCSYMLDKKLPHTTAIYLSFFNLSHTEQNHEKMRKCETDLGT